MYGGWNGYEGLNSELGSRDRCKLAHNTYARREGESVVVRFHDTYICRANPDGACQLFTGGWYTLTTRDRLARCLPARWVIHRVRGQFWLCFGGWNGPRYLFAEGCTVWPDGRIEGALSADEVGAQVKEAQAERRQVGAYAKRYTLAWYAGRIAPPSGPDCCEGQGPEHYRAHMAEAERHSYPAWWICRAVERGPSSEAMRLVVDQWRGRMTEAQYRKAQVLNRMYSQEGVGWLQAGPVGALIRGDLQKCLRRWLLARLGMAA